MKKYRMRVYRPSRPEPELWQTHDIPAENDAAALSSAWQRLKELRTELADSEPASVLRSLALNFSLFDGNRLVFESVRKDAR